MPLPLLAVCRSTSCLPSTSSTSSRSPSAQQHRIYRAKSQRLACHILRLLGGHFFTLSSSHDAMPAQPPSSAPLASPTTCLPPEVLLGVFKYLDHPRDLYHASLTSKAWRAVAIDARLWEVHYWRFYRVGFSAAGSEQDDVLLKRKEQREHAKMLLWFDEATASSLPLDSFSPFVTRDITSGRNSLYEPLARGLLVWLIKLDGNGGEALEAMFDFVEAEVKAKGTIDPEEATPRILAHLETLFEPQPTPEDKAYANSNFDKYLWGLNQIVSFSPPGEVPPPPFLQLSTTTAPSLDFNALFRARMNADEQLLLALEEHIQLQTGTLDSMLRLVAGHGDTARDFLAALASEQRVTRESVANFVQLGHDHADDQPPMRALNVHTRAAAGLCHSLSAQCLSFQYAASNMLAHLQRRDAVRSLQALRERWNQPGDEKETLRVRVMRRCEALEEGIEALSLFGHTERGELRQYLDLLALFVWTNAQAYEALGSKKLGQASSASQSAASGKTTTRTLMAHITNFLSSFNLGLALGDDFQDPLNSFPNVVLCCPVQRKTTSTILLAIVCAVARRLGIAATLRATPHITAAVVLEDGAEPTSWPGDSEDREWKRFFLLPIGSRDISVAELGAARACMSIGNQGPLEEASLTRILEPASPTTILLQAALHLLATLGDAPPQPGDDATLGPSQDFPVHKASTSQVKTARDDLSALSNYLSGHSSSPPFPLTPALLQSSLSALPSTLARAPRDKSKVWRSETLGMMGWLVRLLEPSTAGGAAGAEQQIAASCVGNPAVWAHHRGDLALLIEVNGGNVEQALEAARQRGEDGMEEDAAEDDEGDGAVGASSPAMRRYICQALVLDHLPCNGTGGSGRVGPAQRDIATLRPRDESYSPRLRAQHSIGTVFKHRLHGYYGVVVGRESVCSAPESWMIEHGIVSSS